LPQEIDKYETWLDQLRGPDCYPEHKVAVNRNWEPVGFEDPDAFMRSVLDLKYIINPQEIAVYDWKTGKIYDDHVDQKRLYAAMVFAEHPEVRIIRSTHTYLDLGKNVVVSFHKDEAKDLQTMWRQRAEEVEKDLDFMPSPSHRCIWCGYSKKVGGPCRF
jgi:CRISPR/Cas system-associated exonuclease Cas4 (RecB family)